MARLKVQDPQRALLAVIFAAWWEAHAHRPIAVADLDEAARDLIDPQGRGRQFVASYLEKLVDVRVAGFTLTRQKSPGKWGAATYALRSTTPIADSQYDTAR